MSICLWLEFIGMISGYSYIKLKGEIVGVCWGYVGSDLMYMEDFYNLDGIMCSVDDIIVMWKVWNIKLEQ